LPPSTLAAGLLVLLTFFSAKMALPFPMVDPDDPEFKGKSWAMVEQNLRRRDAYMMAIAGYDVEVPEETGPSILKPDRPLFAAFPWEEVTEPFERKPACTQKDWKHKCLSYTLGKQTATLAFAKPAQNNTIDQDMIDALQDAIMDLETRKDVRVVIIKSEGKLFCNGLDPRFLMGESDKAEKDIVASHLQFAKVLHCLSRLPQFVIALVQGSAMGASIGLLSACDMVIAVKGAFFAMSEAKLGVVPTTSIPYILARIPRMANARQLLVAAQSLSASLAKEYGLINEVVENEEGLAAEAKMICDRMTLCAPGAVAATKQIVMNTVGVGPSSFMLNYVAETLAQVRKGPEAKGGIEAIQSKKKPAWASTPVVL